MPKEFPEMTLAEAAAELGISKRRVRAIIADGSGRLKVSRTVQLGAVSVHMLRAKDVEAFKPFVQGRSGRPRKK